MPEVTLSIRTIREFRNYGIPGCLKLSEFRFFTDRIVFPQFCLILPLRVRRFPVFSNIHGIPKFRNSETQTSPHRWERGIFPFPRKGGPDNNVPAKSEYVPNRAVSFQKLRGLSETPGNSKIPKLWNL